MISRRILYFDCFSGISGDMTIGALLDLGGSRRLLEAELRKLGLSKEYRLRVGRGKRRQVTGTKFDVHLTHSPKSARHGDDHDHHDGHGHHHHGGDKHHHEHAHGRSYADIRRLIERSRLSSLVRTRALSLFRRIAEVEGKIHGVPAAKVHFHEVGAIDSIVDIVGACVLIEDLAPAQILASVPCEGQGFVECAHGRFPVPTTATLELLKGKPLRQIEVEGELITPTGAAILAEFAQGFGPMPVMTVEKIGYGLGTRTYPDHPNVLRVVLGRAEAVSSGGEVDVIEANLDDATPEILAAAMARMFEEGARDVFLTPIVMKKGRAATMISVLADPVESARLAGVLLRETGSFGVRLRRAERICLAREIRRVRTKFGVVEVKEGSLDGSVVVTKPEFESCRRLAKTRRVPVRVVWAAAMAKMGGG